MRTLTKTVYDWSELSPAAQKSALDADRDVNICGYDWFDYIKTDFEHILGLVGFTDVTTYFSGFYWQGDGASFCGNYAYSRGSLVSVKSHAPNDTALHEIVRSINAVQKRYLYGITCQVTTSGNYCHENTMSVTFDNTVRADASQNGQYIAISAADDAALSELFKELARWYYKQLRTEYEYLTSDEVVADTLMANDYEYSFDGERV